MDTLELMRAFVAVVDAGSFTQAGERLGRSKAVVSKHVSELELRLGVRLLNRTTRQIALTAVGRAYAERARELLDEIGALEDAVRSEQAEPSGRLRVTAPQAFGERELMQLVCSFQQRHPAIALEIRFEDRFVDLVAEGFDVAIRIAELEDSSLIARRLCGMAMVVCAGPGYLASHGTPETFEDLAAHRCIADTNMRIPAIWRFRRGAEIVQVPIQSDLSINSVQAVRETLLAGLGIGLCPEFAVARDIAAGRLVTMFADAPAYDTALYLVYPHRLHLAGRVRAFIDHLVAEFRDGPPWNAA